MRGPSVKGSEGSGLLPHSPPFEAQADHALSKQVSEQVRGLGGVGSQLSGISGTVQHSQERAGTTRF